jgi:hypothetical protein
VSAGIEGIEQVDGLVAVLQNLAASGPEFAVAGTNAALAWCKSEVAAGRDPNTGTAYPPTKKGTRPLQHAADAITSSVVGTTGILRVSGYHVYQHWGAGYVPARGIIPRGKMPAKMGDAIRLGLIPPFEAKTKRGKMGTTKFEAWKAAKGKT